MSISASLVNQFPEIFGARKVEKYSLVESAQTPTILPNAGAGSSSGASATLVGDSGGGQITLTTGTTIPAGGGTLFTVTLPNQLAEAPIILFDEADSDSATYMQGTANPYPVSAGSISFSLVGGSITPLTAYIFNYSIPNAKVSVVINTKFLMKPDSVIGSNVVDQSFSGNAATIKVRPNFANAVIEISGVH